MEKNNFLDIPVSVFELLFCMNMNKILELGTVICDKFWSKIMQHPLHTVLVDHFQNLPPISGHFHAFTLEHSMDCSKRFCRLNNGLYFH